MGYSIVSRSIIRSEIFIAGDRQGEMRSVYGEVDLRDNALDKRAVIVINFNEDSPENRKIEVSTFEGVSRCVNIYSTECTYYNENSPYRPFGYISDDLYGLSEKFMRSLDNNQAFVLD